MTTASTKSWSDVKRDRATAAEAPAPVPRIALMRAYVGTEEVELATYGRLLALVSPHGWTPLMTAEHASYYRAWLRHTDGRRLFGRPAGSAEAAARSLLAKVTPMAGGR